MEKKEFETWFYRVADKDLLWYLEKWQIEKVKKIAMKGIKKGQSNKK